MHMNRKRFFATLVMVLPFFTPTFGQDGNKEIIAKKVTGSILRPKQLTPTPALISTLDLPPGFTITTFADKLGKFRMRRNPTCIP